MTGSQFIARVAFFAALYAGAALALGFLTLC